MFLRKEMRNVGRILGTCWIDFGDILVRSWRVLGEFSGTLLSLIEAPPLIVGPPYISGGGLQVLVRLKSAPNSGAPQKIFACGACKNTKNFSPQAHFIIPHAHKNVEGGPCSNLHVFFFTLISGAPRHSRGARACIGGAPLLGTKEYTRRFQKRA